MGAVGIACVWAKACMTGREIYSQAHLSIIKARGTGPSMALGFGRLAKEQ